MQNQARSVDKYTEKEYNDFGWARANDILTAEENAELRSKFAAAKSNQTNPPKTKSGEFMITLNVRVGNEYYENKIAYMKGTIRNPIITRIVEIDEYNETELAEIRSHLYETERRGFEQKTQGIYRRYDVSDFGSNVALKRNESKMPRHNNELGVDRGRSGKKTKRAVRYTDNEDGTITIYYSDGTVETETAQFSARKKTRFDVNTRLDLVDTAKRNKLASDAASKGLLLEYQRNLRSYAAAETTWRIARYHKDTDAIVAAATAMQLRRNTIASIECTKAFAEMFGKLDIPYLVEETSAENGLSETALQNAKEAVRRARQELSEAERDAIKFYGIFERKDS